MDDQTSQSLSSAEVNKDSAHTFLASPDPTVGRFVAIPPVRKIKEAMLNNVAKRKTITWEVADFSQLSSKQTAAIQQVISSLLYSEAHGGEVCGNLVNRVPYSDISEAFAVQILDESHHSRLLTQYLRGTMKCPVRKPPFLSWLAIEQLKRLRDPIICTMAASHFVECAAAEVQIELVHKVEEPLLRQIFQVILRDEARHQALGREALVFLLATPLYKKKWKREKAFIYRYFLEFYARITLNQYSDFASLFGIDIQRIHRRTLEKVHQSVPF
jgi:ribonucleotide reductase beta subunit family protein with ferritin-like domain